MRERIAIALLVLSFLTSGTTNSQSFEITYDEIVAQDLSFVRQMSVGKANSVPTKVKYLVVLNLISGQYPPDAEQKLQYVKQLFETSARSTLLQRYGKEIPPEFEIRRLKNADTDKLKVELVADGYVFRTRFPLQDAGWNSTTDLYMKEVFEQSSAQAFPCVVLLHSEATIDEEGRVHLNVTSEMCETISESDLVSANNEEPWQGNLLDELIAPVAPPEGYVEEKSTPDVVQSETSEKNISRNSPISRAEIESETNAVLQFLNGNEGAKSWMLPEGDKHRIALGETEIYKSIPFTWFGEAQRLRLVIRAESVTMNIEDLSDEWQE